MKRNHRGLASAPRLLASVVVFGTVACGRSDRGAVPASGTAPPPAAESHPPSPAGSASPAEAVRQGPPPDAWALQAAIARVEEERGGGSGPVQVPEELRHATDRRRFLAVQMADSLDEQYRRPHDQAELALMIERGEMVELAPLTEDYVLYEVGEDAGEDPLAHYDAESGKDVPLFGSMEEYEQADTRLAVEAAGMGRPAREAAARRERMARLYRDAVRREALFAEHRAITRLAGDFGGERYDLADPAARARFHTRLLSFIRPEARAILEEVARSYRERFARPLPITSVVRTERYQRRLSRVNPNATRVDIPPHTTGMAFDISYKYMPPDEQNVLMAEVARLEEQGRVEALRERRNHIHLYAFADGPPPEPLVEQLLDDVGAARPARAAKSNAGRARLRRASGALRQRAAR